MASWQFGYEYVLVANGTTLNDHLPPPSSWTRLGQAQVDRFIQQENAVVILTLFSAYVPYKLEAQALQPGNQGNMLYLYNRVKKHQPDALLIRRVLVTPYVTWVDKVLFYEPWTMDLLISLKPYAVQRLWEIRPQRLKQNIVHVWHI